MFFILRTTVKLFTETYKLWGESTDHISYSDLSHSQCEHAACSNFKYT